MNYFLIVIILVLSGGMYYMHMQDQQQIDSLQAQLATAPKAGPDAAGPVASVPATTPAAPGTATVKDITSEAAQKTHDLDSAPPALSTGSPAPAAPAVPVAVVQPVTHSSAIDAAAAAAQAAANSASIGNITTLDNHTYMNCKVLKVEQDGVTFSHDEGITKIPYPMMPPDVQAKFGYTPQQAVAQTEAQIRAEQQQSALTNAPANP